MLGNGVYLMQGLSPAFKVTRGKLYRVEHLASGDVAYCTTQRKVRNLMRAYTTKGHFSTKGRE